MLLLLHLEVGVRGASECVTDVAVAAVRLELVNEELLVDGIPGTRVLLSEQYHATVDDAGQLLLAPHSPWGAVHDEAAPEVVTLDELLGVVAVPVEEAVSTAAGVAASVRVACVGCSVQDELDDR